jgi:hypothetical protein
VRSLVGEPHTRAYHGSDIDQLPDGHFWYGRLERRRFNPELCLDDLEHACLAGD